jgi:steroid delta-isomerase-like uncharacterized protein
MRHAIYLSRSPLLGFPTCAFYVDFAGAGHLGGQPHTRKSRLREIYAVFGGIQFAHASLASAAANTPVVCSSGFEFLRGPRIIGPFILSQPRRIRPKARHSNHLEQVMISSEPSEVAKAVIRRNTEEVQGGGNFEVFEELFADDFLDHTPQPGRTPDKDGARQLYKILRTAFPDFQADIHWQLAEGDRVTTYKTYHGTHRGEFLGVAPTGRKTHFETVDVMRVRGGKITEHWGVANLFSLMQQLGAWPPKA